MHDPFPIPPIPWLSKAVQPFADYFSFPTLPLHIHEVLGSFLFYTLAQHVISPYVSKKYFPIRYSNFPEKTRINWDVHVVSFIQSTLINVLALWVMYVDEERWNMDWKQRVWGYTGASGMIQGFATGYFLWDLMVTIQHVKIFGLGMLAHAVSALLVFSFGFRPFVNFYACTFILYELSSPFLNIHWFCDKLDLTGSKIQLYNGLLLLFTFMSCRLFWGTYQSVRVYQDVWAAIHHKPAAAEIHLDALLNNNTAAALDARAGNSAAPIHSDIMRFAGEEFIPLWLGFIYLGSNVILNTLNFYWFNQMIAAVKKRFVPPKDGVKHEKPIVVKSSGVDGKSTVVVDDLEVRRRVAAAVDAPIIDAIS